MSRSAAIAAVVALFLAGVAIGALGVLAFDRPPPWRDRPDRPGHVSDRRGLLSPRMVERLELTDDQQRRLTTLLESSRIEADAIRDELRPRLDGLLERTRDEVDSVLTPAQRAELESMHGDRRGHALDLLLGPRGRGRPGDPPSRRGPPRR